MVMKKPPWTLRPVNSEDGEAPHEENGDVTPWRNRGRTLGVHIVAAVGIATLSARLHVDAETFRSTAVVAFVCAFSRQYGQHAVHLRSFSLEQNTEERMNVNSSRGGQSTTR